MLTPALAQLHPLPRLGGGTVADLGIEGGHNWFLIALHVRTVVLCEF
jgi:hypothetical protein